MLNSHKLDSGNMEYAKGPHIQVHHLDMACQELDTKIIWLQEWLSFEEIEKALDNYIKFKNSRKGRRKMLGFMKEGELTEEYLKSLLEYGTISKSTYYRYRKDIRSSKLIVKPEVEK